MFLKVRKWSPYLRVDFVVVLLGPHPPPHQIVLDHMSGSQVVVSSLGDIAVLDDGEMKVTVEGLLGVRDILDLGYPTNGNLTAPLQVRLRQCHSRIPQWILGAYNPSYVSPVERNGFKP